MSFMVVVAQSELGLKKELREMLPIIVYKESFSIRDSQWVDFLLLFFLFCLCLIVIDVVIAYLVFSIVFIIAVFVMNYLFFLALYMIISPQPPYYEPLYYSAFLVEFSSDDSVIF